MIAIDADHDLNKAYWHLVDIILIIDNHLTE
jgi:hypothetical protein